MNIVESLEQFGFDQKQARVYLALLELGQAKATQIAKKTMLERPTVYDILEKLSKNGFAAFYEKRGVRYYVAEPPERIHRAFVEKERRFEQLMPELRSFQNTLQSKPRIRYYEGVEGIKTIFEDTLTVRNRKLCGILSVTDLFKIPGKTFMDDYVRRRVAGHIALRVIRSRQKEVPEYWPTNPQALRTLRYTPAGMVFAMTMYVYDEKVALISTQQEQYGMLIESKELSDNMSHLFETLWNASTPA